MTKAQFSGSNWTKGEEESSYTTVTGPKSLDRQLMIRKTVGTSMDKSLADRVAVSRLCPRVLAFIGNTSTPFILTSVRSAYTQPDTGPLLGPEIRGFHPESAERLGSAAARSYPAMDTPN